VNRCVLNFCISGLLVLAIGYNGIPIGFVVGMACTAPLAFHGLRPGAMGRVLAGVAWLLPPFALATVLGRAVLLLPLPLFTGTALAGVACAGSYAVIAYLAGPMWLRSRMQRLGAGCAALFGRRSATPV
jgi:hypothetical protein